jgi:hypothetical protein
LQLETVVWGVLLWQFFTPDVVSWLSFTTVDMALGPGFNTPAKNVFMTAMRIVDTNKQYIVSCEIGREEEE